MGNMRFKRFNYYQKKKNMNRRNEGVRREEICLGSLANGVMGREGGDLLEKVDFGIQKQMLQLNIRLDNKTHGRREILLGFSHKGRIVADQQSLIFNAFSFSLPLFFLND